MDFPDFTRQFLIQENPFDGMCRIETQQVTKKCLHWLEANKYQMTKPRVRSGIGKLLNQMGVIAIGKGGRGALCDLPDNSVFREKFSSLLGYNQHEIFD